MLRRLWVNHSQPRTQVRGPCNATPFRGDAQETGIVHDLATGTSRTEGSVGPGEALEVTAESDQLVLFGDGIETDTLPLAWGQTARLRLASRSLRLLR